MDSTKSPSLHSCQKDVEIPKVESFLHSTFRPIDPRPDFVRSLRSRLSNPANVQPSGESVYYLLALIVIAMSTIVLILVAAIRLLSELIGGFREKRLFDIHSQGASRNLSGTSGAQIQVFTR